jgi:excisionase family DNA binding protein
VAEFCGFCGFCGSPLGVAADHPTRVVEGATVSEQPITPLPALMSVPEAALFLGLSRASAYRYADAGQLPIKRFGRRVYVVRARLAQLLDSDALNIVEEDAA